MGEGVAFWMAVQMRANAGCLDVQSQRDASDTKQNRMVGIDMKI